jgi:hypothetical protein
MLPELSDESGPSDPAGRQLRGFIFHSPPSSTEEVVGRVIERGYESEVRPLVYEKKT